MERAVEYGPITPEVREYLKKVDAIFVLPLYPFPQELVGLSRHGIGERIFGLPKTYNHSGLLFDTRFRDHAAGSLATSVSETEYRKPVIIPMSRRIRPWMKDTFANLQADHIRRFYKKALIQTEQESYDLATEIEEIPAMCNEHEWENIVIIADEEQAKRVERLIAQIENFPENKIVYAEDILQDKKLTKHNELFAEMFKNKRYKLFKVLWKLREATARNLPNDFLKWIDDKTRS